MRWKAVIFDLDDTLYPESAFVKSGFRAVAEWAEEQLGIPKDDGEATLLSYYDNGVRANTFNLWLENFKMPVEDVQACIEIYRAHIPKIHPFDDVHPTLATLKPHCKLGLVSDGYESVQKNKWQALDLSSYFDKVVFSDMFGRENWKPSPVPFLSVLETLAISPSLAVYVGDNPLKDFIAPHQLGMLAIQCKREGGEYGHLHPPTPQATPDITISSLTQLMDVLSC